MPNYPLPFSAEQIQGYLNKVASPATDAIAGSAQLITSGAVHDAISEIELLGGGGSGGITKEDVEALGINVNLDQIGDLTNLTLDFDNITGDVNVNANDINDVENIFINAQQITTGTIEADRINNLSLANVTSIGSLRINGNQIDNLTIQADQITDINQQIETVSGNLTYRINQLENISDYEDLYNAIVNSNNVAIDQNIETVAGGITISLGQLTNVTSMSDFNESFAESVNSAIDNSITEFTNGDLVTTIESAISSTDISGLTGSSLVTSINSVVSSAVTAATSDITVDVGNVENVTNINDFGESFANSVNSAISTEVTSQFGSFSVSTGNLTNITQLSDINSSMVDSVNSAIDTRVGNNADLNIIARSVSSQFDLDSISNLSGFNNFIANGISTVVTSANGDIVIQVDGDVTSTVNINGIDLENLADSLGDDIGVLQGLIENNALKIDATLINGGLTLGSNPTAEEQAAFDGIMSTISGNVTIDIGVLTGILEASNGVTVNVDTLIGTLPAPSAEGVDYSNVVVEGSNVNNLESAIQSLNFLQTTDVAGNQTLNLQDVTVTNISVDKTDVVGFAELETAVNNITFASLAGSAVDFTNVNVSGITTGGITNFESGVQEIIGNISFNDIQGDLNFSDVTVTGLNSLGLGISNISGLQTALDSVTATVSFADITGDFDATGITVTGLSHTSIGDFNSQVETLTSNITPDQISFVNDDGFLVLGTGANQIQIPPLSVTNIENLTQEIESVAANMNFIRNNVDANGDVILDSEGNPTVNLTDVNVIGISYAAEDLTGSSLPDGITISGSNITSSLIADKLNIQEGALDVLGTQTIAQYISSIDIEANTISAGATINLGDLNFTGELPAINIAAVQIDVNNLTASDFDFIASNVQGDINVNITQVQDADVLFDFDEVDGNVTINHVKASAIEGEIDTTRVTFSGTGLGGLPSGTQWRRVQIIEDGDPIQVYLPTLLSPP